MGLAASQARLLTITARKADAEFQSMALSHQKLALSRNMEKISSEYQEALNATKLVYDYYGSGDSDMGLTYGLLMNPSIYNDYFPKLITDAKDRVVLNSAYAAAAKKQGFLQKVCLEHLQVMSATNSLKLYAVKTLLPLHRQQLLKVFLTAIKLVLVQQFQLNNH